MPPPGDLAFVTQSDSIATAMLEWASAEGIGFSCIASLGEFAEIELGDILDYLALDLATRAILIHLEGIADARRFMSAARAAARIKPVLVLKAGRCIGQSADLPGGIGLRLNRDQVYDAAFARAGLVRVESIEELFAAAASLGPGAQRRGHGLRRGRLAILTNGHGPAELAADALLLGGGALVRPTPPIHEAIEAAAGEVASLASAVDLGPDANGDAYAAALDVLLETPDHRGGTRHPRPLRPASIPARWQPRWRRQPTGASRAARSARYSRPGWARSARSRRGRPSTRRRSPTSGRPRPPCAPSCIGSSTSGGSSCCARSRPRGPTARATGNVRQG